MPETPDALQKRDQSNGEPSAPSSDPSPDPPSATVNAEYLPAEKALQKLEKPEIISLAAFFSSKMTLGPDPESAKLMAETEMHEESCRLEGYKANLKSQDAESGRGHEFRMKRLNHDTFLTAMVLLIGIAGAGAGLYLTIKGSTGTGSNILIASVALIYYIMGGKNPFHKKED